MTPRGKIVAIIPTAGSGRRLGGETPKQFLNIQGKPIIIHTLEKFNRCSIIDEVILIVPTSYVGRARETVTRWGPLKVKAVIAGGEERQDSVQNGLDHLPEDVEIVVVHDGVRPFVSAEKIHEVGEKARECGGAILAVPVKDTVKIGREGWVEQTLDRDTLWSVQTPQAFRVDWIRKAYEKAKKEGYYATDDAALVERLGHRVAIVMGEEKNIKITTPADFSLAEMVVKKEMA
jgi:2-C-methyl-D-erythritol 4-phosphate cytidylyltransferase